MANRWVRVVTTWVLCALAGSNAIAEEGSVERYVAGTHYAVLDVPVAVRDESKLEVVEIFSYACIHCYNFDPYVSEWKKTVAEDVDFYLVPAVFNADWERLAQAYYTAEALGIVEAVHMRMFDGIHNRQEDLRDVNVVAPIFAELGGVDEADVHKVWGSFSVKGRVQQARAKLRAYKIDAVPTMVVNGKYRVGGRMAGSNRAILEIVDFLLAKERAERQ